MPKKVLTIIKKFAYFILCVGILILTPIIACTESGNAKSDKTPVMLNLWQIDSFEGGRGSRATYLQKIANAFSKESNCFITVMSISAEAARLNMRSGNTPDLISYRAGTYGIEQFIHGKKPFYTWCYGGYCLLTTETNSAFSDVTAQNTVINAGTGNFAGAAALLNGLKDAKQEKPTGAYVKLINGEYKYLLGTQRDVYRLKTREVTFSVKPLTEYNDLYQNISLCCDAPQRAVFAEKFINYLMDHRDDLDNIGLMCESKKIYSDEMSQMDGLTYVNRLISPISENIKIEIDTAIANSDENKLKNLLK